MGRGQNASNKKNITLKKEQARLQGKQTYITSYYSQAPLTNQVQGSANTAYRNDSQGVYSTQSKQRKRAIHGRWESLYLCNLLIR